MNKKIVSALLIIMIIMCGAGNVIGATNETKTKYLNSTYGTMEAVLSGYKRNYPSANYKGISYTTETTKTVPVIIAQCGITKMGTGEVISPGYPYEYEEEYNTDYAGYYWETQTEEQYQYTYVGYGSHEVRDDYSAWGLYTSCQTP